MPILFSYCIRPANRLCYLVGFSTQINSEHCSCTVQCDICIITLAFLQEGVDYFRLLYGWKLLILGFHTEPDKHILVMSMKILSVPKFSFGSDP